MFGGDARDIDQATAQQRVAQVGAGVSQCVQDELGAAGRAHSLEARPHVPDPVT